MTTGKPCIICSTKSFISTYKTSPGVVHPSSLMNMLPSINLRFQRGQQQCAAEFFQEFCRVLDCESEKATTMALSRLDHFDLSFSKTFFFNQRSEILCLNCNKVSTNSAMEQSFLCILIRYDFQLQ